MPPSPDAADHVSYWSSKPAHLLSGWWRCRTSSFHQTVKHASFFLPTYPKTRPSCLDGPCLAVKRGPGGGQMGDTIQAVPLMEDPKSVLPLGRNLTAIWPTASACCMPARHLLIHTSGCQPSGFGQDCSTVFGCIWKRHCGQQQICFPPCRSLSGRLILCPNAL